MCLATCGEWEARFLACNLPDLRLPKGGDKLRRGLQEMPAWIFPSMAGTPLDHANVEKALKRVLKAAELPLHYTPHCLRHSFASLLLQQGVSPAYVQRHSATRRSR